MKTLLDSGSTFWAKILPIALHQMAHNGELSLLLMLSGLRWWQTDFPIIDTISSYSQELTCGDIWVPYKYLKLL